MIATRLALALTCLATGLSAAAAETAKPAAAQPAKPATAAAKAAPVAMEEPRDIVAAIYKQAALDAANDNGSPFANRETRRKYLTKDFGSLVESAEVQAKSDHRASLNFDPISASKDAELQKVTLKTDLIELGKAVVSASFSNHGQPTVVTYDFVKEDGGWKINDIKGTTEKEAWSVRKILTASGKPPQALPGETKAPAGEMTSSGAKDAADAKARGK